MSDMAPYPDDSPPPSTPPAGAPVTNVEVREWQRAVVGLEADVVLSLRETRAALVEHASEESERYAALATSLQGLHRALVQESDRAERRHQATLAALRDLDGRVAESEAALLALASHTTARQSVTNEALDETRRVADEAHATARRALERGAAGVGAGAVALEVLTRLATNEGVIDLLRRLW